MAVTVRNEICIYKVQRNNRRNSCLLLVCLTMKLTFPRAFGLSICMRNRISTLSAFNLHTPVLLFFQMSENA